MANYYNDLVDLCCRQTRLPLKIQSIYFTDALYMYVYNMYLYMTMYEYMHI